MHHDLISRVLWRRAAVLRLFEHLFYLLFNCAWVKLVSLNNMWKLSINIELVVFIDNLRVKLRDGNLILADINNAMLIWYFLI